MSRSNKRCFLSGVFPSVVFRGWPGSARGEGSKVPENTGVFGHNLLLCNRGFPNLLLAKRRLVSGAQGTNLSNIFRSGEGPHPRVPNGGRFYCLFPSVVERLVAAPRSPHEVTPMRVLGSLSLTHLVLTVGLGILDVRVYPVTSPR